MKKYFLFSLLVVCSFVFYDSNDVFAGGANCTTKGWVYVVSCDFNNNTCKADPFDPANPNVKPGETVTLTDTDENGDCIPTENNPVCGNGTKEGNEQCDDGNLTNGDGCNSICQNENDNDDNNSDDQEGDLRIKLKTYDCNGNEESKKIEGSKVKLYERDGDKVETNKTNSKGEANFRDIETGKYKVKCEVDGYISMKDRSKTAYESGYEKIKDGERATETCRLIKKTCDGNKLAKTGGSLFDYIWSLVF